MSIEHAIAIFFQAYAAAFSACDVAAIGSLWDYPAFLSAGDRAVTYADEKSFSENTAKLCEFYQTQGVTEATKELISVDELYPTIVQARTKDRLFSADGELVAEWEHVYLLRHSSAGWKAITAIADGEIQAWSERSMLIDGNVLSGS